MAFEYHLSKAINITVRENVFEQKIIELEFKYVRFELTLDDEEKTKSLLQALTGAVFKEQQQDDAKVKMPNLYKGEGDE